MAAVEPTSLSANTPTDISELPPPPTESVSSSSDTPKQSTGLYIQTNVQPQHPLPQTLPPDSATTNYRERTQSLNSTSTYNLFRSKTRVGHSTSSLQSHLSNSHSGNGEIQSRGSITSVSTPRRQNSDPSIADGSLSKETPKEWFVSILHEYRNVASSDFELQALQFPDEITLPILFGTYENRSSIQDYLTKITWSARTYEDLNSKIDSAWNSDDFDEPSSIFKSSQKLKLTFQHYNDSNIPDDPHYILKQESVTIENLLEHLLLPKRDNANSEKTAPKSPLSPVGQPISPRRMTIGEKESKDCIDPYIVGLVLSTYHLFIHPIALLNTLIDTYKSLPNTVPTSQRLVVLNNIATFLFKWVSLSWVDFTLNKDLFDTLDEFVKSLTNHTGGNPDEAGISFRLSAKLSEAIKNQRLNRLSPNYLKSNSNLSSKVDTTKSLIIEFDPVTLAQHLALINQEYVSRVPTTLLLQLLLSPAKVVGGSHDPRLKPIMDYCLWIKNFSNWVFSAIYTAGTAKKRANVVKKFIKVANESTLLHDWQGMAVITATLRRPWVMFQKDLWEGVGGKYIQMFKEMDTFLDPKRYFMRYRSNLSQSQPPGVPVLCAHIYELIRLHNLLPTFTSNNSTSTHLNISKIETIFTHALVPLLTYQSSSSSPYPFKSTLSNVTPIVLSYIQSFPVWEESVVWEREMNGVDIVGTIASLSNSSSLWKRMGRMGSLRRLGMGSSSNVSSVGSMGNLSNTGSSSGSSGALKNLRTKMFVVKKMTESQNNPGKNLSDTSNQEETNSSLSGSGTGTGSASGNSSPAISAQRKKGVKSLGNVMAKVDESDQDQS